MSEPQWVDITAALRELAPSASRGLQPLMTQAANALASRDATIAALNEELTITHRDLFKAQEELQGPDGHATWKDAALYERLFHGATKKECAALQAEVERYKAALLVAYRHLDMQSLQISHCEDHRIIQAAISEPPSGERSQDVHAIPWNRRSTEWPDIVAAIRSIYPREGHTGCGEIAMAAADKIEQLQRQMTIALPPSGETKEPRSCAGCGLDATDACPHCDLATCGECENCEHGPSSAQSGETSAQENNHE